MRGEALLLSYLFLIVFCRVIKGRYKGSAGSEIIESCSQYLWA